MTTFGTIITDLSCEVVLFLKVLGNQYKMTSLINKSLQWVKMLSQLMRRGAFLRVIRGLAYWMGFLAQKVEHQRTKLKVAGSIPAEVHFSSGCFSPQ